MTIKFPCEHCGKNVEAPDSAGGKRGRCPFCKQSNYIPAPVSEDELYDFVPEDDADQQRVRAEEAALRAQEEALLGEAGGGGDPPLVPLEHREDVTADDVQHLVVNYCLDMAASKLARAQTHVAELRKAPDAAREAVAGFLTGQLLEPALDGIPTKVLHGFLQQLDHELHE